MLLFKDCHFMLVVEAKDVAVRRLQVRTYADLRHRRNVTIHACSPEARQFAEWCMALFEVNKA